MGGGGGGGTCCFHSDGLDNRDFSDSDDRYKCYVPSKFDMITNHLPVDRIGLEIRSRRNELRTTIWTT